MLTEAPSKTFDSILLAKSNSTIVLKFSKRFNVSNTTFDSLIPGVPEISKERSLAR